MAKKQADGDGVNKSQAIREYLTANPDVKPIDVAKALSEKGIDVSPAFVSQIKLKLKQGGGEPKRPGRRKKAAAAPRAAAAAAAAPAAAAGSKGGFQTADLLEAKKLVDKLGAAKALAAVELLAKLS
jgi:hypothetical protein